MGVVDRSIEKDATFLPLNSGFTAYHVLLPLQGKEFSFAVHNVPPPKHAGKVSLQHAKLECGSELRTLLTGVEHVVQERLNQSWDLPTFVLELKDVLERIVRTQLVSSSPKPTFYTNLCSNLDVVGWEHLAWLSPDLTIVHLRLFDVAGREHIVQIDLPAGFPEENPKASADLPISVDLGLLQGLSLKGILSLYQSAVENFQDFWTVMEDIDKRVWVMEPDHPSRANSFRRIALGGHCSLSIIIDPLSPRSMPENLKDHTVFYCTPANLKQFTSSLEEILSRCRFFGSDGVISPLRKKLNSGFKRWDQQRLVVANLEDVLDMTFPSSQDTEEEDMSADCGICYAYRASDETTWAEEKAGKQGKVPDRICNNANCARPFHSSCLTEWLRSITSTRQSFDVLFGHCPYCSHPIAVKRG